MKTWLRQHRLALGSAARKLSAQKSTALASILAIGIAISLPLGGYALLEPLRGLVGRIAVEPQLTAYIRLEARRSETEATARLLRQNAQIASVRLVSREAALRELASVDGLDDILATLDSNPLPDALILQPRDTSAEALERLAKELRALPSIARVQADSLWARRLAAFGAIGRLGLLFLSTLLAFGLIAVTFNTIRLQILTLRDEIEVSKLLGATDSYIRRPYYYLGVIQGALGGGVALAVVWLGIHLLNAEIRLLADSYGSTFRIPYPPAPDVLSVVLCAGLLGWLGAHLSVDRHLREIEPH